MRFVADERGQSVLVGTILLFGILIIAFSSYQAFVVPNQNAEVEFNHNSEVQTDMQDLRNSLLDIRSVRHIDESRYEIVSEHRSARIQLGTQYPSRIIALNPPPVSGTLSTGSEEEVQLRNAEVHSGDFDGDPEAMLDDLEDGDFETQPIRYRPNYNEYQNAPTTVFEHSLMYNRFQENDIAVTNQRLIRDTQINLALFEGDISRTSSQAVTLEPETLDGPTDTVPIESSGGDIELEIPTDAPTLWADDSVIGTEFGDETAAPNAKVDPVPEEGDSTITIILRELDDPEKNYTLRVAKVGYDGGQKRERLKNIQSTHATAPGPPFSQGDIDIRVDDLTNIRGNQPRFHVSASASGLDEDVDSIEVIASSRDSAARDSDVVTGDRGGVRLSPGGAGERFLISTIALDEDDADIDSRSVTTIADTENPENDDLGDGINAEISDLTIRDQTQVQQNSVRYRFQYEAQGDDFTQIELHTTNRDGNGATGFVSRNQLTGNTWVEPGDGANQEYKLSTLIFDSDNVVVDSDITIDTADSTDP